MQPIEAADLPPRLAELAGVIGLAATLRLVEARGGTRVYVPEAANDDHWLMRLIGRGPFERLVAWRPREHVELDRAAGALRAARDRQILAEHQAGASSSALALQYGLTQRQIFNILARSSADEDDATPDLFGPAH